MPLAIFVLGHMCAKTHDLTAEANHQLANIARRWTQGLRLSNFGSVRTHSRIQARELRKVNWTARSGSPNIKIADERVYFACLLLDTKWLCQYMC